MMIADQTNTTPWITGKSRAIRASNTRRPRPGQTNTVSVVIDEAMMMPNIKPRKVTTGMKALSKACFQITRHSGYCPSFSLMDFIRQGKQGLDLGQLIRELSWYPIG